MRENPGECHGQPSGDRCGSVAASRVCAFCGGVGGGEFRIEGFTPP